MYLVSTSLRNNNITDEGIKKLIAKSIHCDNFCKIAWVLSQMLWFDIWFVYFVLNNLRILFLCSLFNNKLTDACAKDFSLLLKTKQNFVSLRSEQQNIPKLKQILI